MADTNIGDLVADTIDLAGTPAIDLEDLVTAAEVLSVPDVASGGVLAAHVTQTMTHSIRIQSADGTQYWIMVTNAATNRTGGA
jgi:hypothetical protein